MRRNIRSGKKARPNVYNACPSLKHNNHDFWLMMLSKIKYYLYFYRYNIIIPSTVFGIIGWDYFALKKKKEKKLKYATGKSS